MKTLYQILLCSSLIALAACNQPQPVVDPPVGDPPPVVSQPTDTTAPKIVAQMPANGAADVAARDPITLTFSEAMKPETVNAQTLSLKVNGAAIAARVSLSQDGKTATIAPENYADLGLEDATLNVELGKVTDLAGNALEGAGEWSWKVPAWLELPNFALDANTDTDNVELILDKNDRPYLVWNQFVGTRIGDCGGFSRFSDYRTRFHLRTWTGKFWEAVRVPALSTQTVYLNLPTFDSNNKAWIVVEGAEGQQRVGSLLQTGTDGLELVSRANSASWAGARNSTIQLFYGADQLYSLWFLDAGFTEIKRWNGTSWETIGDSRSLRVIGNSAVQAIRLNTDSSGRLVVAWSEELWNPGNSTSTSFLFAKRYNDGVWEDLFQGVRGIGLRPDTHFISNYLFAKDAENNLVLAWQEIPSPSRERSPDTRLLVARWTGTSWVNTQDERNPLERSQLLVDGRGRLINFGRDDVNRTLQISRWVGNQWSPPTSFSDGVRRFQEQRDPIDGSARVRSVEFDRNGNALVAWTLGGCLNRPQGAVVLRQNR